MADVIKTARGTPIKRYKNLVGKQVGKQLYVHRKYAVLVIPAEKLVAAGKVFNKAFPFDAVMYDAEKNIVRFDEAPDFDTAREPKVGRYFAVNLDTGEVKEGKSDSIWHHKWLWVQDDYTGFDVEASKEWSRKWAGSLPEVAKGTERSFKEQLAKYGIVAGSRSTVSAATLERKRHRFDTYFYGDDSGNWTASKALLGFRGEWDWEMAPSLSSKNDWRNFSVEGATESNFGFRKALQEIVAEYPEVEDFWLSFDGPMRPVTEVLGVPESWDDIVFLHGTSMTLLPSIEKGGLLPRGQTGGKPSYGYGSSAMPSNPDLLYFTTQEGMAQFAARAAVGVYGGEPVILEVSGLDKAKAEPDEDSHEKTAEASLGRMGSIGYRGRVSPSQIRARR